MNIPSDKATIGRIVIIKISSLLDAIGMFFPTIYAGETHLISY